jgi:MscS family membrane protein
VGSLLAGVGIGGAAIAFASKDAIANVFGSLVIFVDRPFQIGDWVEIGEVEGTVEEVRMRVTAIRTFANSVVTVPNSQMTITPIHNWSRMRKRRLKLEVRVAYGTDPDQLQAAVEGIRKLIEEDERFDSQFYLVNFNEMSEWSLNIFIYCFTKTTMWAEHMEIREALLLSVMRLLRERDITQAVPARSISVEGGSSRPGLPPGLRRPA